MLTGMKQLAVFVGGSTGSDPYAANTWSGSSRGLLAALGRANMLDRAIGVKLKRPVEMALMLKNFAIDRAVWRRHFYFDPAYRCALTRVASAVAVQAPCCLQIGHMFSLPAAFPGKDCFSYHDGNLPMTLASGYGLEGVSARRITQALRYEEQVAQAMTGIFTFSEYLRQSFIHDFHVTADKVFNIGGAVNLDRIPDVPADKRYDNKQLLFIGVDFARKGGPLLLEAFARVHQKDPQVELHIVGPASIGKVPSGVTMHGRLSRADPAQSATLDSLFESCSLFVMPSLYEPFGIAPLEAMFYGLPCLVTDAWALREHVTPGENGDLAEKGSVDDVAAKLERMLADPDRLATMGKHAREFVLSRFTWDAVAGRMKQHLPAQTAPTS
jgi:starch synthase